MENEQKVRIHDDCVLLTYQSHPHRASGGRTMTLSWCTLLTLGPAMHDRVSHTVPSGQNNPVLSATPSAGVLNCRSQLDSQGGLTSA